MSVQKPFGQDDHDSLQYHFFCGDIVGACRVFHTNSLQHASLWLFDGTTYREVMSENGTFDEIDTSALRVRTGDLTLEAAQEEIAITYGAAGADPDISIRLAPVQETSWSDTISTVIHQPIMDVTLTLDGVTHKGAGYCKRYAWTPAPRHWGYRFIQGFVDNGATSIWTAEATFGLEKYDYFKIMRTDGSLVTTPDDVSCHRKNGAFGQTSEGSIQIELEPLSTWDALLESEGMSSRMQQRACQMIVRLDRWEKKGLAINETCYGTLG